MPVEKKIDIFIKSHQPDFWLLQLALKTITKNVTGYQNIILLIPEDQKEQFDTRDMPERTLIHYVKDLHPGWLAQQWFKMSAYNYSYADYIMFSDSDNFFDHPIDLQEILKDGKPEILYTNYNQLPDAIVWKEPTEKFISEELQYEFMRRLPLTYHRDTLVNISKYAPNLQETILSSHRWSEFNCMGAYAYKFEREKYSFINTDEWTYTKPHSTQVWSHSNKNGDMLHLKEYCRILETIIISFGLPLPQ